MIEHSLASCWTAIDNVAVGIGSIWFDERVSVVQSLCQTSCIERHLAKWAISVLMTPLFDALAVEVVALVTG